MGKAGVSTQITIRLKGMGEPGDDRKAFEVLEVKIL